MHILLSIIPILVNPFGASGVQTSHSFTISLYIAILAFFYALPKHPKIRHKYATGIYKAIAISAILVSFIGSFQFIFKLDQPIQIAPPASTFGNKNFAAQYVVLLLPLSLYLVATQRKQQLWKSWKPALCVQLLYILFAHSKASYIALSVELLIFATIYSFNWGKKQDRQTITRTYALALTTIVILFSLYVPVKVYAQKYLYKSTSELSLSALNGIATESLSGYGTLGARIDRYKNTIAMFKENWLTGVGLGNWEKYYPLYYKSAAVDKQFNEKTQPKYAHNDFLQFIAETGIVGILFLILFIGLAIWSYPKEKLNTEEKRLHLAIFTALAGLAVNAQFSFPFYRPITLFIAAIYLAILLYKTDKVLSIKRGRKAIALTALLFSGYMAYHYGKLIIGDTYYKKMRIEELTGTPTGVIKESLKVEKYAPGYEDLYLIRGKALLKLNKNELAIEDFKKGLEQKPYSTALLGSMANAYGQKGDYVTSNEWFSKTLDIYPNDSKSEANMAINYTRLQKLDSAVIHIDRAVSIFEVFSSEVYKANVFEQPEQLYLLKGSINANAGNFNKAEESYRKALSINGYFTDGYKELLQLLKQIQPDSEEILKIEEILSYLEKQ